MQILHYILAFFKESSPIVFEYLEKSPVRTATTCKTNSRPDSVGKRGHSQGLGGSSQERSTVNTPVVSLGFPFSPVSGKSNLFGMKSIQPCTQVFPHGINANGWLHLHSCNMQ